MNNYKYYEEPSEFEEKCLELEQLREENAKMKDIVDNYNQKVEELEVEKKKYHLNEKALRSEIEKEVKRLRLGELSKDFQSTLYVVRNVGKSKPKCDKCDKDGYIHYLSPRGQELLESCECREPIPFYKVLESYCIESFYDTYFRDKDTAQRYADWLNERVEEGK